MSCGLTLNMFVFLAIGRTLIPRYFRSIFEGGATELFYVLKHPKESFHSNFVSLDCDQCTMVTQNGKPMFTQVNRFKEHLQSVCPLRSGCCKLIAVTLEYGSTLQKFDPVYDYCG